MTPQEKPPYDATQNFFMERLGDLAASTAQLGSSISRAQDQISSIEKVISAQDYLRQEFTKRIDETTQSIMRFENVFGTAIAEIKSQLKANEAVVDLKTQSYVKKSEADQGHVNAAMQQSLAIINQALGALSEQVKKIPTSADLHIISTRLESIEKDYSVSQQSVAEKLKEYDKRLDENELYQERIRSYIVAIGLIFTIVSPVITSFIMSILKV